MNNPYETPNVDLASSVQIENVSPRWFDWVFWFLAATPALAIYFTWVVAWICLGHPPRPSLDDPKHIGPIVSVAYLLSLLSFPLIPIGTFIGPITQMVAGGRNVSTRAVFAGISGFIGVLTVLLLRWDPLRVVYWYMD